MNKSKIELYPCICGRQPEVITNEEYEPKKGDFLYTTSVVCSSCSGHYLEVSSSCHRESDATYSAKKKWNKLFHYSPSYHPWYNINNI